MIFAFEILSSYRGCLEIIHYSMDCSTLGVEEVILSQHNRYEPSLRLC